MCDIRQNVRRCESGNPLLRDPIEQIAARQADHRVRYEVIDEDVGIDATRNNDVRIMAGGLLRVGCCADV
jgi:hypothetical protein